MVSSNLPMAVNDVEVAALKEIRRSRSEPAIQCKGRGLLAYRESLSFRSRRPDGSPR
jgi:hypothetical protein